jgi:hypothetical protein
MRKVDYINWTNITNRQRSNIEVDVKMQDFYYLTIYFY